jgi:CheY-like chemotaxis protein
MAKVMVVDDAYSELKLMESILKSAGHEVVSLMDGDALEDKLSVERPDVLLLDIVMPKRNGYEILRLAQGHPHEDDARRSGQQQEPGERPCLGQAARRGRVSRQAVHL